jgi:hypothetical protein
MSRQPGRKFDVEIWEEGENKAPLSAANRVEILAEALGAEITKAPLCADLPLPRIAQELADAMDAYTARIKAFQAQFRGATQ